MNWFEAVEQVGHAFAQDMTYFHNALKLRRTSFGTCLRTFGASVERNETFYFSRMSKLIYITNTSLDGYVEDETGAFDSVIPDQVHAFITELLRPIETHLYGRRLYETMAYWDAPVEGYPPEHRDFAQIWQKAEKIVFSRT